MKLSYRIFIIILLYWPLQFFSACSDSQDEDLLVYALPSVEQLLAESGEGMITLSWENPSIEGEAYHIEIIYEKGNEEQLLKVEPQGKSTSKVLITITDQEVYRFRVSVVNSIGERSDEKTVKGKALTPEVIEEPDENPYDLILETVNIYGAPNGVNAVWDNPANKPATIEISYFDASEDIVSATVDASSLLKELFISGLNADIEIEFSVEVKSGDKGSSFVKKLNVTPKRLIKKLKKDEWEITASSEEITEEDGRAVNLIDGTPETYWKTRISENAAQYPHYVIIDLKETINVTAISLERKLGDSVNSSWDNTIAISLDGKDWNTSYDYYSKQTDPKLKIEFNRTRDGEQMYPLPFPTQGRYIKLTCKRASKTFAIFGELSVYGYR